MKPKNIDSTYINSKNMREPLVHELNAPASTPFNWKKLILPAVCVIAGLASGFVLHQKNQLSVNSPITGPGTVVKENGKKVVVGTTNESAVKDSAEGKLEAGGIKREGTHKLIRPGGDSQTVYLTSSFLDLTQFEGKQVKVYGETFAAKQAGWLMDVGKVEVLE